MILKEEELLTKLPKHIYHLSDKNHNDEIFYPKEFNGASYKNNLEKKTSRICFSDNINGAINAINAEGQYDFYLYVHIPDFSYNNYKVYRKNLYIWNL